MTKKMNYNPVTGQFDLTDDGVSIQVADYVQTNLTQTIEDIVATRVHEGVTTLIDTNEAVYGEDTKGVPDPTGQSYGWYFRNSEAVTNKINWNFVANLNTQNEMKLQTFNGFYAVVKIMGGTKLPQFELYTAPQGDGQDAAVSYRTKRVFKNTTEDVYAAIGETIVLHYGDVTNILPNLRRVELDLDNVNIEGPDDATEDVLLGRLSTLIGCSEGDYEFVVTQVGFKNNNNRTDHLLITAALAELAPVDMAYSQNYYVALDSTEDHIVLNGVGSGVLDSSAGSGSWCVGIELPDVDPADNDNWWATLFKSGFNTIQIARGAGNFGVYFMCGPTAQSAGQANTWYPVNSGSKILFQYDDVNRKFEYWVDGVRRAYISVNANSNAGGHTAGELVIGQGYRYDYKNVYSSNDWIGGVDNLMVGDILLDNTQIAEYFSLSDVSTATFYDDIIDFVPLGEQSYPNITGMKQVITGTLQDGTEDDFVER